VSPNSLVAGVVSGGSTGILAGARCVAAGVRVTFTGNYTSTDGVFYGAVLPKECITPVYWASQTAVQREEAAQPQFAPRTLSDLVNTYGVKALDAEDGIQVNWVPQDPQSVTFTPIMKAADRRMTQLASEVDTTLGASDADGRAALNTPIGFTVQEQLNAVPSCIIWGEGLNPNGRYLVEAHAFFECTVGPAAMSLIPTAPSPSDPIGFSRAISTIAHVDTVSPSPASHAGAIAKAGQRSRLGEMLGAFGDMALETTRRLGPALVNKGVASLGALLL
jgi:hypothetical protein